MSRKDGIRKCRYQEKIIFDKTADGKHIILKAASCNCGWANEESNTDENYRKIQWQSHRYASSS